VSDHFRDRPHSSLQEDFDSLLSGVKARIIRIDKEANFLTDLKLALCFDRHSSLVSAIPIALIVAAPWTEGFSLLVYMMAVFCEFFCCRNERGNAIIRQFNALAENNVMFQVLHVAKVNHTQARGIHGPARTERCHSRFRMRNRGIRPGVVHFAIMHNVESIGFLADCSDGRVIISSQEYEMFRVYGGCWERAFKECAEEMSVLVGRISETVSRMVEEDGIEDDLSLVRKKIDATDLNVAIWSEYICTEERFLDIQEKIEMFEDPDSACPKGSLFVGPPGTGKTLLARKIAETTMCRFFPLSLPDIKKAGGPGKSAEAVRALWDEAKIDSPSIIFIDECEGVFRNRGDFRTDTETEDIIQAILAEWDGILSQQDVWLIAATNRADIVDPAAMSRFEAEYEILPPSADHLLELLRNEAYHAEVRLPALPPEFSIELVGLSGRDLANVAKELKARTYSREITDKDVLEEVLDIRRKGRAKVDGKASWDTLVLDSDTHDRLVNLCTMLRNSESIRKQGHQVPGAVLLHGPPGTGKTQIARTIANEGGLSFFSKGPSDLLDPASGASGKNVKRLFDDARAASPSILFLDEIEAVAPVRSKLASGDNRIEVVTNLLQEMDGASKRESGHVTVIAATNIPENLDPAIMSRFGVRIEIPLPGIEEREKLLRIFLAGKTLKFDENTVIAKIASSTNGKSGRDLRAIVDAASENAVRRAMTPGTISEIVIEEGDFSHAHSKA
jgi:SpoVK/Ycf46/Vps4 family AAA+-type ATPase